MSDVSRADAEHERRYSNEKNLEESQAGAVPRLEADNESSIDSLQDGVKGMEAISQAWNRTSLIVAYCRYVCCVLIPGKASRKFDRITVSCCWLSSSLWKAKSPGPLWLS
jgi:hypothetical protein